MWTGHPEGRLNEVRSPRERRRRRPGRPWPRPRGLNEVRSPKERRPGRAGAEHTLRVRASTKSALQRSGDRRHRPLGHPWRTHASTKSALQRSGDPSPRPRTRSRSRCLNEVRSPKERRRRGCRPAPRCTACLNEVRSPKERRPVARTTSWGPSSLNEVRSPKERRLCRGRRVPGA